MKINWSQNLTRNQGCSLHLQQVILSFTVSLLGISSSRQTLSPNASPPEDTCKQSALWGYKHPWHYNQKRLSWGVINPACVKQSDQQHHQQHPYNECSQKLPRLCFLGSKVQGTQSNSAEGAGRTMCFKVSPLDRQTDFIMYYKTSRREVGLLSFM